MGARRQRKEKFIKEHPLCCFCGGQQAATTEDHVPSRNLFFGRKWPKGYNFSACENCNSRTRKSEMIAATNIKFNGLNKEEFESKQWVKEYKEISRRYPEDMPQRAPRSSHDAFFETTGLDPNSKLGRSPFTKFHSPRMRDHARVYLLKLLLALYYKHTNGKIFPLEGIIALRVIPFYLLLDEATSKFYNEFGQYTHNHEFPIKEKNLVTDEFTYDWDFYDDAFLVRGEFHMSTFFAGYCEPVPREIASNIDLLKKRFEVQTLKEFLEDEFLNT